MRWMPDHWFTKTRRKATSSFQRIITFALLAGVFWFCPPSESSVLAQDECAAMRRELLQLRTELSELVDALNKSNAQEDYTLMGVLNYKINQLITRSKELERGLANCPEVPQNVAPPGMSGTKSEEGILAEKSCSELRKMLLPLMRKINSLKRREKSVLSGLTAEEKTELSKAESDLALIKETLTRKCNAKPASESLRKRLRR